MIRARWLAPFGVMDRSVGIGWRESRKASIAGMWRECVCVGVVLSLDLRAWSWYDGRISRDNRVLIVFVVCFRKTNQSAESPLASPVSVVLVDIINGTDGDW